MIENLNVRPDLSGIRTLVVGLAREGTALAPFLAERGARVTVTDARLADDLAESIDALSEYPVDFALGGHPNWLLDDVDIVFVSPGVPLEIPLLVEARRRGIPLSSETRLFTRLCPAAITGITGSAGKSTTTALTGKMLQASGRKTWVGGNIGEPLIGRLADIVAADAVVLELSSFQLELFGPWAAGSFLQRSRGAEQAPTFDEAGWSPAIAGVLNIVPNHLDRHGTMENYTAAKSHILGFQAPGDTAVLNLDNAVTRRMGRHLPANRRVLWFTLEEDVEEGAFLSRERLMLRLGGIETTICRVDEVQLLGRHNLANCLAACALAAAGGASPEALRQVATSFEGVEHRLEPVLLRHGVRWYNDSKATTPDGTIAALRSFDAPIVLLAGGRDKDLPWEEMAALTWRKVRHLILFGEAAPLIDKAMTSSDSASADSCQIHYAGELAQAVELAAKVSQPGDVVLLSPGGTSYDAYHDYAERGDHFRRLVKELS